MAPLAPARLAALDDALSELLTMLESSEQ
jgi:hypothetical protein